MRVVIIGSGNVATVLGKLIYNAGHDILQVLGRNENKAKALAQHFNASWGSFRSSQYKDADLYLLAITDTSLHHLEEYTQLKNKLIVHTAGSVSMQVLNTLSNRYGVIYPLQSLIKISPENIEIPFLIDGNTGDTIKHLEEFCKTFAKNVTVADDNERLKFHIGAVFVNNFSNHIFAMADEFCRQENIQFEKLFPLVDETMRRIKLYPPISVQTGPAIREDIYTLGKHLQLLSSQPDLKYLYLKLSESILKHHQKK